MPFEVNADAKRHRVQVVLTDFASLDDVRRFESDLLRAIGELSSTRGPHQLLYDVSQAKIQSQEVVGALRELALRSQRTSAFALVNASALAGRQLRRIFDGIPVYICEDRYEATRWLDDQAS